MSVMSRAYIVERVRGVDAVRHEPCRLLDQPRLRSNAASPRRHSKLAHVCHDFSHIIVPLQFQNAIKIPATRHPWVFMMEEPPLAPLVFIDLGAEFDVSFGLLNLLLESLHPRLVIAIHVLVDLLQLETQSRALVRSSVFHPSISRGPWLCRNSTCSSNP